MPTDSAPADSAAPRPLIARALVLGERIDTLGLERADALSVTPLSFRVGDNGFAAIFRYGVAVLIGLSPVEEDQLLHGLERRVGRPARDREEETARIEQASGREDRIDADGVIRVAEITPERLLVIADAMAKGVALAHDERYVTKVFEEIEPWARDLAEKGRRTGRRRDTLKLIGRALLVQHRVAERVAVAETPDILWDRPDLSRLYARLQAEYELVERGDSLNRKLALIGETAQLITDLIDTERSLRLEMAVVLLIVAEVVLTLVEMIRGGWG